MISSTTASFAGAGGVCGAAGAVLSTVLLLSRLFPPTTVSASILTSTTPLIKDCIDPVRMKWSNQCGTPQIQTRFCHKETCYNDEKDVSIRGGSQEKSNRLNHDIQSDACNFVKHALLAEFPVFDVIFLQDSACARAEIHQGSFTYDDAVQVLPTNDEMIGLQVTGSSLLDALEHGLHLYHSHGIVDAYPRAAGIRFTVSPDNTNGNRISGAEILSLSCKWQPVEPTKLYHILTTQSMLLAAGGGGNDDDGSFNVSPPSYYKEILTTRSVTSVKTGRNITDAFYFHLKSVCVVRDPFRKPKQLPLNKSNTATATGRRRQKRKVIKLTSLPNSSASNQTKQLYV